MNYLQYIFNHKQRWSPLQWKAANVVPYNEEKIGKQCTTEVKSAFKMTFLSNSYNFMLIAVAWKLRKSYKIYFDKKSPYFPTAVFLPTIFNGSGKIFPFYLFASSTKTRIADDIKTDFGAKLIK